MNRRNHTILQGLLRSGITLDEVVKNYKLKINRSRRHPSLVQFKYDQLESNLDDPLVRQCRGIIMDESDNWEIVARPFDKFFNYGESGAAEIDWNNTARVLEKLDGTCCILYYYQGWHVATLGSADASGPVGGLDLTFERLFWQAFADKNYIVPDTMWAQVTFIFELMTPYNRVVVPHKENDLKLIGARIASGDETKLETFKEYGYEPVRSFSMSSMADLQDSFWEMNGIEQEGYVVVDAKNQRIKVKHPEYVRIHHMKDGFTIRNIVECVRHGDDIEFLDYFPEHKDIVNLVKASFHDLVDDCLETYQLVEDIRDKKEFASQVKDFPFNGVLFAVHNGKKPSVIAALQDMHVDNLINLLKMPEAAAT